MTVSRDTNCKKSLCLPRVKPSPTLPWLSSFLDRSSAVLTVKPCVSVFGTCGHTADCRPVGQAVCVEILRCSAVIKPLSDTILKILVIVCVLLYS